jgi:hypothetical protein
VDVVADADTAGAVAPPSLSIGIEEVAPLPHAAVPTLSFTAAVHASGGADVRAVMLETQIRIAADRRPYTARESDRLVELFGGGGGGRPRASLRWAHTTTVVPAFSGATTAAVPVACTYDFEVVATKYLHAATDGEVPLSFLFSGTVFYQAGGGVQVARLPWHTEADFRMPVWVWHDLMEHYFPGSAWLRLDRDTFDQLYAYRTRHALLTWTDTLHSLLAAGEG